MCTMTSGRVEKAKKKKNYTETWASLGNGMIMSEAYKNPIFLFFHCSARRALCVIKTSSREKKKISTFFSFRFFMSSIFVFHFPAESAAQRKTNKKFFLPSLFCCCCFYVSSSVVMERMFDCAERRQRNTLWYVYLIHMSMNMRTRKIVFVRLRIYIPAAAVKARHKHWIQPECKKFWWLHACVNNCLVYSFFLVLSSFIIHRHHTSIPFYTIFQYSFLISRWRTCRPFLFCFSIIMSFSVMDNLVIKAPDDFWS